MPQTEIRPADAADAYPPLGYGAYVVGVLLFGYILAYLDRQILSLLVPDLRRALQITDTEVSLLQGLAFALFFAVAGLPLGRLVDRTNRRNVLIFGIAVWTGSTFACAMAQNFGQLFTARLLVGGGEATLAPAALSIVADYFAPAHRGKANGVMLAGPAVGIGIASFLGGVIIQALAADGGLTLPVLGHLDTWRAVFVMCSAPGVPLILLLCAMKEPVRRGAGQTADSAQPMAFWSYMRRHRGLLTGVFLAFGSCNLAGYAVISWAPAVLMRVNHVPAGKAGMLLGLAMLAVNSFGALFGGVLSDALVKRFPLDGRLRTALIVLPGAMAFLALFAITGSPAVVVIAYAGSSAPTSALNAVCYATLYDVVPNQLRGQVVAAYLLVTTMLGVGFGPTLVALVTDYVFHDDNMVPYSILVVGGGAFLISIACVLAIVRPYRALRASVAG